MYLLAPIPTDNSDMCLLSYKNTNEIVHAVLGSDNKIYDAFWLQKWLRKQSEYSESYFVIPDLLIKNVLIENWFCFVFNKTMLVGPNALKTVVYFCPVICLHFVIVFFYTTLRIFKILVTKTFTIDGKTKMIHEQIKTIAVQTKTIAVQTTNYYDTGYQKKKYCIPSQNSAFRAYSKKGDLFGNFAMQG